MQLQLHFFFFLSPSALENDDNATQKQIQGPIIISGKKQQGMLQIAAFNSRHSRTLASLYFYVRDHFNDHDRDDDQDQVAL